ncbi:hypothetical protein WALSEDRAFT_61039 [Wallemia mellicola CBS 633.66]|uniref:Uncharacterized protein n=1 Tax=Wallemia mellicola (strain ATCC MYA-4683 / CBS 633.66) TaxID=671144 RepID=I4Y881_WALMC|nr:hypothetical protein WALSEDRAFT_61039 [Wallemia mellicola CBS 633.66]EIM20173.1 hypothetical protein WALSEDRAFT_61039 [Wallemia mellicola CBS 633.66]|eukprot:XP_006959661.1 hypothetical protein WALSEDRAFT_61039 [Wallemia mellicola CBS 633.66]
MISQIIGAELVDTSFLVGFFFGSLAIPISFVTYITLARGMAVWVNYRASIDFYDHKDCVTFRVPLWSYWKGSSNPDSGEKRMKGCEPREITFISISDRKLCRKLCVGTYAFGVAGALAFASINTIGYAGCAWAYAFNYRREFEGGRVLVSS